MTATRQRRLQIAGFLVGSAFLFCVVGCAKPNSTAPVDRPPPQPAAPVTPSHQPAPPPSAEPSIGTVPAEPPQAGNQPAPPQPPDQPPGQTTPDFITILGRFDLAADASVNSQIDGNHLVVDTHNVRRLRMNRELLPVRQDRSIALTLDGQGIEWRSSSETVELQRTPAGAWQAVEAGR